MAKTKALSPTDGLKHSLKAMVPQFAAALPKHINPEKFSRVLMTAVSNSPGLVKLERNSFFSACMRCAQDGLMPDNKEAAIVPYGDKAQYLPMIAGILKKVRNSGELASLTSQLVYKEDQFEYWVDTDGEHLNHRPTLFGDRGECIGVYALAKTKDGAIYIEVMTADQIGDVQKMSKGKNTPWNGPFKLEMWKKSALRRLSKKLPMSTDLESTITADDNLYDLNPEPSEVNVTESEPAAPSKLMDAINVKSEPVVEPPVVEENEEVPI